MCFAPNYWQDLNVIRHITDSNSWPLVLSVFPELAEHGAYSADEIYSEADVRHIVQYAGEVSPSVFPNLRNLTTLL